MIKSLDQLDVSGKRVFVRADLNTPVDPQSGAVVDDQKLRALLPTVQELIDRDARVILAAHLGEPGGDPVPALSLEPAGARLSELLGGEVICSDDCVGDGVRKLVGDLRDGQVLLLENLRFHHAEEQNDEPFSRELASFAEVYLGDSLGAAARTSSSSVGMVRHLKQRGRGRCLERELERLGALAGAPARPFVAVVGGSGVAAKCRAVEALLGLADKVLLGGPVAYTFIAAQGGAVGGTPVERDKLEQARRVLDKAKRLGRTLFLPFDHLVAPTGAAPGPVLLGNVKEGPIPDGLAAIDVGPTTLALWKQQIRAARSLLLCGPVGRLDGPAGTSGTGVLLEAALEATKAGATAVVVGDEPLVRAGGEGPGPFLTVDAAAFELLEGRTLPGLLALET